MATIDIKSAGGGGSVATGVLQLLNGVALDATLRSVTDQSNTLSPLKLSTSLVQSTSTLKITTNDNPYIDAEDGAGNNRFTVGRATSSQQVNVDFASNPAGSTTAVGAIRTFRDGTNLSEAMTFIEDGSVGIGTTAPVGLLDLFKSAAATRLAIRGDAGQNRLISYRTGALQRFGLYVNNTAESGANAGSNFAIRAYNDAGTLLSTPFFINRATGNVGVGTTTPQGKLDVRTTDGFGSVEIYTNNDSSLPLRLFRANDGLVGINTFSSGGTIDSPSNKTTLGEITRLTGNAYVDGAYRPLASMEYYLDAIPTAGAAPCSIRFLTVAATSSTYALNERMGITNDGNVQINESIVTNRNAKLFIKGSGSTAATTSFLVQNSSGFNAIQVTDDLKVNINTLVFGGNNGYIGINNSPNIDSALRAVRTDGGTSPLSISTGEVGVGDTTTYASAIFAIGSTTRGFLPPRMTTTQKNAITTPAAGLMVYDTTLNKLCVYTTAWETITSI